jgi:hypothetical protein
MKDDHPNDNNPLAEFPLLASLRISADDLRELARQGFVCEEKRGNREYYKLRFRSGGRQVVRYLGNAERAARVEHELSKLQNEAREMRALKAKVKIANKMLREAKIALQPVLAANGLVFHGFAIRQPRTRRHDVSASTNKT